MEVTSAEIENLPKALSLQKEVVLAHQQPARARTRACERIHGTRTGAFTLLKVSLLPMLNMALHSHLLGEKPEKNSDVPKKRMC